MSKTFTARRKEPSEPSNINRIVGILAKFVFDSFLFKFVGGIVSHNFEAVNPCFNLVDKN